MKGLIHSFENLGCLDGDGLRTIIFFAGCPMRCKYCHNADMLSGAAGMPMTQEEVTAKVLRYKNYFAPCGGVTYSGGEPLMQADFLLGLSDKLKGEGIHIALDTAGSIFRKDVLDKVDLTILDIKHADAGRFFELTDYPMENTLKTLEYLQQKGKRFWVRQVILEGYTQSDEQIQSLKKLAVGAEKIELLPYHTMGAVKWEKAGLSYALGSVKPPPKETMERLEKIIKE